MPAGIVEVDAPAAVPIIERAIPGPWILAERYAGVLNALPDGIELPIAHMESIVMHVEVLGIIEIEGQRVIDAHGCKMAGCALVLQSEGLGEKAGGSVLILRRYDRVI